MKTKRPENRIVTLLLVVIFLLNLFGPVPLKLVADSQSSATVDGSLDFGTSEIDYTKTLTRTGSSTYELTLKLGAVSSVQKSNEGSTTQKTGYFVAPADGDYVIQAWGGKGGNGENDGSREGGVGGAGGYVFGKVHLEKGEQLYYEVGGNGGSVLSDEPGGAGGGGSHGSLGTQRVGAGGGYSAIYKLAAGQTIGSVDKASAVLLIAGGGGGGGAGDDVVRPLSYSVSSTGAKGGDAGISNGTNGISISGVGTYYSGQNGFSSGKSNDSFVGIGGSNVPGSEVSTWIGANTSTAGQSFANGGMGGDGNFRGGGGGAGYAGGSGGIMSLATEAYYVGGGGGGSSFISSAVSTNLDSYESEKLLSANPAPNEGGYVNISLAGSDPDPLAYLSDISFSGGSSDYMKITSVTVNGTGTPSFTDDSFSISNASIYNNGEISNLTININFTTVDGFPGGNDVPLFDNDLINVAPQGETAQTLPTNDVTGYVNVPFDFTAIGNDCTYDRTVSNPIPVQGSALYTENSSYQAAKAGVGSGIYSFIQSVGDYEVDDSAPASSYAPLASKRYKVSFDVTPVARTNPIATVGTPVTVTEFSDTALITVLNNNTVTLNGNEFNIIKQLSYDAASEDYKLTFIFAGHIVGPREIISLTDSPQSFSGDGSFTVPETGYYLVQAWGGKGGDGGDCRKDNYFYTGGEGADGGYVYSVVRLTQGDVLSITVGLNGTKPSETNGYNKHAPGGPGGGYSSVLNNLGGVLLVAAGGGGGGGANIYSRSVGSKGGDAVHNSTVNSISNISASLSSYNGENGETGSGKSLTDYTTQTKAGESPASAINSTFNEGVYEGCSQESLNAINAAASAGTKSEGYVTITPLDTANYELEVKPFDSFVTDFTQYFTLEGITSTGLITTGDNAFTYSTNNSTNEVTLLNLCPENVGISNNESEDVEFSLTFSLKPIEGFLGGNDIPLLEDAVLSQTDTNSDNSDDAVSIEAQDDTDYVNVEIPEFTITGIDAEYIIGGTSVVMDDMYDDTFPTVADGSILDDFVDLTDITVDPTFNGAPDEDTTYTFSAKIEPKTETPEKAVVILTATAVEESAQATIYVFASVKHTLTHITCIDQCTTPVKKPLRAEYGTTLVADSGYSLPPTITVKRNGTVLPATSYSYNKDTGRVTLPADVMTGAMEIIAEAVEAMSSITIVRANSTNEGNGTQTFVYKISDGTNVYYATVTGNSQTTINLLPLGDYTVTQMNGWSERFDDSSKTVTLDSAEGETVTFNAAATADKWLSAAGNPATNVKD